MSDERLIQVSALADGALDDYALDELSANLQHDPGLRDHWERYHLIGHIIRREPVAPDARGIADRVSAALAREPGKVTRLPTRRSPRPGVAPFAGAALAASAAFLAVFAIPGLFHWMDDDSAIVEARATAPRLASPDQVRGAPAIWEQHPELASKLNLYLLNHQESAPAAGVRGVLPYVNFVTHDAP